MSKLFKKLTGPLVSLFFLLNMTSTGYAETTVSAEIGFIFNTLLFLICGFLVFFMACGFAMLESGMVTSKSVSVICAKNIGLVSIAGIMFWMFGYNLAYGIPEGGYIGKFIPWSDASKIDTGYADGSDWYFQMVFCATTVSIVSGTLAERIKLWPFFLFAAILSGILYPIVMGWQWGGGWLAVAGFSDFAGSTLVHSTGGAAALAGAGGVLAAAVTTRLVFGKTDVIQMLNGCIGGLVAITAEPLMPSPLASILIGAVGGVIVVYGTKLLFSLKIDDVVGAIPAHLFAGIWGTLAVPITNSGASFGTQLLGVVSINAFVFIVSFIVWFLMKSTFGIRLSKEGETKGTDVTETGVIAYAIRD